MSRKKTDLEFKAEIAGRDFVALEGYKGRSVKIMFRCGVCNHEWSAMPGNILQGKGCPGCQHYNEILKDFQDGSILIGISTKKFPSRTSRMDLEDFVLMEGRIWYDSHGYPTVRVNEKIIRVHQLIMPNPPEDHEVDHRSRDRCDNRRCNLRYVTRLVNMSNKGKYKNNKSGVPGVHWDKKANKWRAQIRIKGIQKYTKHFDSLNDAKIARKAREKALGLN